jgi:integrase
MLRRIKIKSKAEAGRVEKQLVIKINQSFEKTISPLWKNLLAEFVNSSRERGLSIKTIENRELNLKAYTLDDWGELVITQITTSHIRELILTKAKNKSEDQKKNLLKYIRLCFEYAVETGHLNRNPAPRMKFKTGDKVKKVLKETQLKLFLDAAKAEHVPWYPIWATAVYTGMRNGELFALTWDKVNLDERQIVVDCAWDNKAGFKSTKSGDERIVEIAPNLLHVLKELKVKNSNESNFVLPRLDRWKKGEQARELRMFLAGLGLPQIRFHDLRASWATVMLGKGVPAIKVMRMGGWREMKTMQVYMRMAGIDIKGITDELHLHDPYTQNASLLHLK